MLDSIKIVMAIVNSVVKDVQDVHLQLNVMHVLYQVLTIMMEHVDVLQVHSLPKQLIMLDIVNNVLLTVKVVIMPSHVIVAEQDLFFQLIILVYVLKEIISTHLDNAFHVSLDVKSVQTQQTVINVLFH